MRTASRQAETVQRGRKRAKLALGGLTTALLTFGAGLVASPPPASANVGSDTYTIGVATNDVSGVHASPDVVVQGSPSDYVVKFVVTEPLSGTTGGTITVTSSVPLSTGPSNIAILDDTDTACFQAGTNGGEVTSASLSVQLVSSCQLSAGDLVEVDFKAGSPAATGSFDFTVTTSANTVPASSNTVVVSASPPVLSVSSSDLGANATYTVTDASWSASALPGHPDLLVLTAKALSGATVSWYPGAAGYSVTEVPASGALVTDYVNSAMLSTTTDAGDTVTLVLQDAIVADDAVTIVAKGTNPIVSSSEEVSVTPAAGPQASTSQVGQAETSTNAVPLGTSVTNVTVSASPPVGGATATYSISFQASTGFAGGSGSDICLNEPVGGTQFFTEIGALVSDTSAGWHVIATGVSFPSGSPAVDPGCDATDNGAVIPLGPGYSVRTGDDVTLTIAAITNPPAGTIGDFSVSTSSDTVPVDAPPYAMAVNGSGGVTVTVSPATTGALATYTISNLVATAALAGGTSVVTLDGAAGTVFPNSADYYTVEDSSTPSGSGTVRAPVTGGGTNDVSLVVPAAVNAGDHLSLTIEDVINPSSAGAGYSITLLGSVTGPSAVAPFPHANLSYPNGAIVSFSGTDYVFAGGHAFGIPTPSDLSLLEVVDHAQVQAAPAGASPPAVAPRMGTVLFTRPVTGDPTVYVVGADGVLHGFATPAQLLGDGYDPALIVTVPNLGGLTVGPTTGQEAAATNALSTAADGAIVVFSGTYYVFAGGRAFGIPSPTSLARAQRVDPAKVLRGVLSTDQPHIAVANGVLFSASGLVYVSYNGALWPFKSEAQLIADGYGGTAAIPVPGSDGLAVVAVYSGA